MKKLLTNGNEKVKALLFDLPTKVCGKTCNSCYAKKSEIRFKNVLKKREYNYDISCGDNFPDLINKEIQTSKQKVVRIHASGDFYSQKYINKWTQIIKDNPEVKFYAYTKAKQNKDLSFKRIEKFSNFNLIDSITPLGYNYGDEAYCKELEKIGYEICPCSSTNKVKCQIECDKCLTIKNVCFLKH